MPLLGGKGWLAVAMDYKRYERDEVKPTVDVIKKLADVLKTTISFLMGETDNQNVFKDPVMFKRMAEIESLPPQKTKNAFC